MATLLNNPTEVASQLGNHKVFPEDDRAVLTLDVNGLIRNCNKAAAKLMKCPTSQLVWQHVSNLLPQLADTELMQNGHINPRLRFLSRVGHRFQLAMPGGGLASGRIFFNDLENAGRHNLRLIICPDDRHELSS
jgi:hypothetical protein